MSPWQMVRQIRAILAAATWGTSPNGLIVGNSCYITAGVDNEQLLTARVPFVLLNVGEGKSDDELPSLLSQDFIVIIATTADLHGMGESHIIGSGSGESPRSAYSAGRGILELSSALIGSVQELTGADGTPMVVTSQSGAQAQKGKSRNLVWQQTILNGVCTRDDVYPAPRNLVATGGVGEIALAWDLPPSRFDLSSVIVRYASGATPPASPTAGTGATLSGDLATSVTITGLVAGTYSVATFARYTDTNVGDAKDSEAATGSSRASVTVS